MVVRLRLARFGKAHAPVYNIVVAHARTARDSKPIEVIGTYDPIPKPDGVKDIQLDTTRAKYWLGVGVQPSFTVWRLLSMFGLLEPRWHVTKLEVNGATVEARKPRRKLDAGMVEKDGAQKVAE